MPISLNDVQHKKLEEDVRDFLQNRGFLVAESTYHAVLPENIRRVLQNLYSPTALYLRGRADRIAIHPQKRIVFEWEAKTHNSKKHHDLTIEALPICHHLSKSHLDVECLYCYRNPHLNYDKGFWVTEIPQTRVIMVPSRWNQSQRDWFARIFTTFFPLTQIVNIRRTAGSGDPFLIIDQSVVESLPSWKAQIDRRIE